MKILKNSRTVSIELFYNNKNRIIILDREISDKLDIENIYIKGKTDSSMEAYLGLDTLKTTVSRLIAGSSLIRSGFISNNHFDLRNSNLNIERLSPRENTILYHNLEQFKILNYQDIPAQKWIKTAYLKTQNVVVIEFTHRKFQTKVQTEMDMCTFEKYGLNIYPKYNARAKIKWYIMVGGVDKFLHILISDKPKNMLVDHIDRNPLNNKKDNLRTVSVQVNIINRDIQNNNTSGVTGVKKTFSKKGVLNGFRSVCRINGKNLTKWFSIKKYGYEEAREMAIKERQRFSKEEVQYL
ncbi:MAG: HNH endonuclease [Sarcina sp.]